MGLPVLNSFDAMTGVSFNGITGLSSSTPGADSGAGAVGTATTAARGDHVHPLTSFDMLSTLVNAESSITTTASPTTFDTMYVCSGTSADYTVGLPSPTGNANKIMAFRMDPALTKLVTLDAGAGVLIDGQRTRIMWANEVAILKVNGAADGWTKIGGKTIPMIVSLATSANQTFLSGVWTLLSTAFATAIIKQAPAAMLTLASSKITIQRPGNYRLNYSVTLASNNSTLNSGYLAVSSGGAYGPTCQFQGPAAIAISAGGIRNFVGVVGTTYQPYALYGGGSYTTSFLYNDGGTGNYHTFAVEEIPSW